VRNGIPIELRDIHKVYDLGEVQIPALQGVSLDIQAREFVAIMGASGSGKSTLMNLIGCLDRPTRGQYCLDGQDVSQLSSAERARVRNRKIGFVFQQFNLLSRTSALENVELPTLYAGLPAEERCRRAREVLRRVGLEGREEHYPSQLSGGQQQRVAIARALINQPSILLADEPTGNLDSRTSGEIMELLDKLNQETGLLVVLVTHEHDIAAHARRIIYMRDGKVLYDQTSADRHEALKNIHHLTEEVEEAELGG
jgi:putative ABC transport system ATP-binding protein